ncbi:MULTISPECIES: hypothetical protein [Streptomyces]|jgi:hypothetical protein|uniref:hypothetical protein n=1 Tax=Streptomyces TaxID=1883 RepID=UPI001CE287A8|nr:hypothetical protein [Streptomyces solaniscabiei]
MLKLERESEIDDAGVFPASLQAERQFQLALIARAGPQSGPRLLRTLALAREGDRGGYP